MDNTISLNIKTVSVAMICKLNEILEKRPPNLTAGNPGEYVD